ncbi:NYN domain-containing protein [Patescibacteria group bacterium]|nr:NYN domain-containing protein [Patescibacteria group bacterium]
MAAIKHKAQRVGLFIDTQNLYHSAKNLFRSRVNFGAVLKEAVAGRVLVHAAAYVVTTESGEEKAFFDALTKLGIETKTKDLQIFYGGAKKADWDVGMAIDAVKFAPKLDAIVLATGDGDFVPLVEYLKSQGTQVEVISFGKSASGRLREAADDFIDMGESPKTYLLSSSRSPYLPAFIAGNQPTDPDQPEKGDADDDDESMPTVVGADTDGK